MTEDEFADLPEEMREVSGPFVLRRNSPFGALRPVLKPPCGECAGALHHAPECGGEPRPETLSQALARAQRAETDRLRDQVRRYLELPDLRQRRTLLPKRGACARCADTPRYPDHRCATHSAFLPEDPVEAHQLDNDDEHWLELWRKFFGRVGSILRT